MYWLGCFGLIFSDSYGLISWFSRCVYYGWWFIGVWVLGMMVDGVVVVGLVVVGVLLGLVGMLVMGVVLGDVDGVFDVLGGFLLGKGRGFWFGIGFIMV